MDCSDSSPEVQRKKTFAIKTHSRNEVLFPETMFFRRRGRTEESNDSGINNHGHSKEDCDMSTSFENVDSCTKLPSPLCDRKRRCSSPLRTLPTSDYGSASNDQQLGSPAVTAEGQENHAEGPKNHAKGAEDHPEEAENHAEGAENHPEGAENHPEGRASGYYLRSRGSSEIAVDDNTQPLITEKKEKIERMSVQQNDTSQPKRTQKKQETYWKSRGRRIGQDET